MKRFSMCFLVACAGLAVGCGASVKDINKTAGDVATGADKVGKTATEVGDEADQRLAEPSKVCYWGKTKNMDANQKVLKEAEVLIERVYLPPAKQIIERDIFRVAGSPDPAMTLTTYDVDRDNFTFEFENVNTGQKVEGTGEFTGGDMWKWSGLKSEAEAGNNMRIVTEKSYENDTAMITTSVVRGADEVVQVAKTEATLLGGDACDKKLSEMGVKALDMKARDTANKGAQQGADEVNKELSR